MADTKTITRRSVLKGGVLLAATSPMLVSAAEMPDEKTLKRYASWLSEEESIIKYRLKLDPMLGAGRDLDTFDWWRRVHDGLEPGPETRAIPTLKAVGLI